MRRRIKSFVMLAMVLMLAIGGTAMLSGCGGETAADNRKVIKVWSMSNEADTLLGYYKLANPDFEKNYKIEFTATNNDDGSYEAALDNSLPSGGGPDLFFTDVDYTKKYAEVDYTVDLTSYYKSSLGLSASAGYSDVVTKLTEDMYQYTIDLGTKSGTTNQLKAISYQVTPGAMFYRADLFLELVKKGITISGEEIADFAALKTKIGLSSSATDANYTSWSQEDKEKLDGIMQTFVAGSENEANPMNVFKDAVAEVAENGYNEGKNASKKIFLINNIEDIKRVFYASRSAFVQNGKVVIDDYMVSFLDYAKALYGNTHKTAQWGTEWSAGMIAANTADADSKTLSFFMPTWGLFYTLNTLPAAQNPSYGYWRMIEGPQAYYWGGSYLFINKASENKDIAFDIIKFIGSKEFMMARSAFSGDVMNSKDINKAFGTMNFSNAYLGGQNHFKVFNKLAEAVSASNVTQYDGAIDRIFTDLAKRYASGEVATLDSAKSSLQSELKSQFSDMTVQIGTGN